jgi:hypothetical protein
MPEHLTNQFVLTLCPSAKPSRYSRSGEVAALVMSLRWGLPFDALTLARIELVEILRAGLSPFTNPPPSHFSLITTASAAQRCASRISADLGCFEHLSPGQFRLPNSFGNLNAKD